MNNLRKIISLFFIIVIISFITIYSSIQYSFSKTDDIEIVTSIPTTLINKVSEV